MTWVEWYDSLWKPGWTPEPSPLASIWEIIKPIPHPDDVRLALCRRFGS